MNKPKVMTVVLPDIGEGVVEGEVLEWLKKVGDSVAQDEPVVVVMTDKATVELPSPCPGRLIKQHVQPGHIAQKDKPLYEIETEIVITQKLTISSSTKPAEAVQKPVHVPSSPISVPSKEVPKQTLAAPPTRQLAKKLEIPIDEIVGTGKDGRVTKEDLARYSQGQKRNPSPGTPSNRNDSEVPLIGIRKLMAKSMALSKAQIPHFSYFEQVDATRLVQLRSHLKEEAMQQEIHVTFMPLILKTLSMCLHQFPQVNSSIDMEKEVLIIHSRHNIGIATATERGLIVPVLKDVQEMNLQQVIIAFEELKNRATQGTLTSEDMKEGTISVSNFGILGSRGLWATPIIRYPEAAILGISKIHKEPIVRNEAIVARDVLNLSWSFDHRIIDGEMAALFSHHFSSLLQNPAALL